MPEYNNCGLCNKTMPDNAFLKAREDAEAELLNAPISTRDVIDAAQKKYAFSDEQLALIERIARDNI